MTKFLQKFLVLLLTVLLFLPAANSHAATKITKTATKKITKVTIEVTSVTHSAKGNTVKWKPSSKKYISGYHVYRRNTATSRWFEFDLIATTEKTTFLDTADLEFGTYQYCVTPYCIYKNKEYPGVQSKAKAVTVPHSETYYNKLNEINLETLKQYGVGLINDQESFGISDISWKPVMRTKEDTYNNLLYCFLIGNYDLDLAVPNEDVNTIVQYMDEIISGKEMSAVYTSLCGVVLNAHCVFKITSKDDYSIISAYYTANGGTPIDTKAAYSQLKDSFTKARDIYSRIHQSFVTSSMSEYDIALCYYNNLPNYITMHNSSSRETDYRTDAIIGATQSCGICCGGASAIYTLMLNMEGIQASSAPAETYENNVRVGGHILSVVKCGNQKYLCDFGNRIPLTAGTNGVLSSSNCEFRIRNSTYTDKAFK